MNPIFGQITGRSPDTDNPTRAGDVTYTARAPVEGSAQSFEIRNTKPIRPYDDDELIHPVKVGAVCIMGRFGARNVIIVQEKVAIEECPAE
jgi:hypothetical protein